MSARRTCEYCRSELPPDATCCPHCGAEPVTPAPVPVTPTPVTPTPTSPQATQQEIVSAPAVGAGLTSQTLSITAFVLALVGLAVIITFIPALIVGIIALKKEPKGKVFAWIAIGISGGIMLIVVILAITTLIQILAAPKPWY